MSGSPFGHVSVSVSSSAYSASSEHHYAHHHQSALVGFAAHHLPFHTSPFHAPESHALPQPHMSLHGGGIFPPIPHHTLQDIQADPRELETFAEKFKQRQIKLAASLLFWHPFDDSFQQMGMAHKPVSEGGVGVNPVSGGLHRLRASRKLTLANRYRTSRFQAWGRSARARSAASSRSSSATTTWWL